MWSRGLIRSCYRVMGGGGAAHGGNGGREKEERGERRGGKRHRDGKSSCQSP